MQAKNCTEEEINEYAYICFDETGNWQPKQNFSDEWGFIFVVFLLKFLKENKTKKMKSQKENQIIQNPTQTVLIQFPLLHLIQTI